MSGYVRCFNKTKYISFLIEDEKLLKACNKMQDKFSNIIPKGFDSESVYTEKYLKTKIKSYDGKSNTNFYENEIPKRFKRFKFRS